MKSINLSDQKEIEPFGEEFFEGGKLIAEGGYRAYEYQNLAPLFNEIVSTAIKVHSPKRVLDIGCAKGFLVMTFQESGIDAFGVDISQYAIDQCPVLIHPNLYQADLSKDVLPFPAEYFDFITCIGVMDYVADYNHAIGEIYRVLKPGGAVHVTVGIVPDQKTALRIQIHPKEWWIRQFNLSDFIYSQELSEVYREAHYMGGLNCPGETWVSKFLCLATKIPLIRKILLRRHRHTTKAAYMIFKKMGKNEDVL